MLFPFRARGWHEWAGSLSFIWKVLVQVCPNELCWNALDLWPLYHRESKETINKVLHIVLSANSDTLMFYWLLEESVFVLRSGIHPHTHHLLPQILSLWRAALMSVFHFWCIEKPDCNCKVLSISVCIMVLNCWNEWSVATSNSEFQLLCLRGLFDLQNKSLYEFWACRIIISSPQNNVK